ncbi:hypothetical protein BRPE64_ACDS00810 [Caballeronia insecticola]|uniref:Uncharacterized protein n=1 Tax=Caballeronia insecticola TaxID=758793 RepID=R4WLY1_9BURK|nr:hypothetical protein BRPE64_ACDS00810 [Caballeronia insecticola]
MALRTIVGAQARLLMPARRAKARNRGLPRERPECHKRCLAYNRTIVR